jgi:PST family polysaccharide transporter
MVFGQTHIFFKRNLFETCVKIPLIIVGAIKFGFMGVVFARGISETITVCYSMIVVRRLLGLPIRNQVWGPWKGIVSTAVMALAVQLSMPRLIHGSTASLAAGLLLVVAIGAITYSVTLIALWVAEGSPSGLEAMITRRICGLIRMWRDTVYQSYLERKANA